MAKDDSTLLESLVDTRRRDAASRMSLVVYFGEEVEVVELEPDAGLVFGRSEPADIVIPAHKISRRHARFTRRAAGVEVEDLGSTNGTHKGGARIEQALLMPGDSVRLGDVTVSVNQTSGGPTHLLRGIEPYERLVDRIEEEIVRARTLMRWCAVMMVRSTGEAPHVSEWLGEVRASLRPIDRVALYGDHAVLAVLPETDRERARTVAAAVSALDAGLRVGVALAGAGAGELIDDARRLAREASAAQPWAVVSDERESASAAPVFASEAMLALRELVERVARAKIPVLVTGETGCGKEIVARAIHGWSPRKDGPMRVVNCGAMPQNLLEATLFGHEKGAFTGATDRKAGLFEQADGGTLFLDEVGELTAAAQVALLRVLETQRVTRVGGVEELSVDVRVVAATHRDLEACVTEGSFREDLLFRINPMTVAIPPLRDRRADLGPLLARFMAEACEGAGVPLKRFDDESLTAIRAYRWPGNVRELRNVVERAVVVCRGDEIGLEDLPEKLLAASAAPLPKDTPAAADAAVDPDADFKSQVRGYETQLILDALQRSEGNQTEAAKVLRMPLRTLVHKIKSYGIKKQFDAE